MYAGKRRVTIWWRGKIGGGRPEVMVFNNGLYCWLVV